MREPRTGLPSFGLLTQGSRLNFESRSGTTNIIVANARGQVERSDQPSTGKPAIKCDLHHAHLFASDLQASIVFYREMFGAEIVLDGEVAGSRNVLLRLGSAYINFYEQPPKDTGRGVVHHLGIRTNDLPGLVAHMNSKGFEFRKEITNLGSLKYVMAAGPDGILLELFETDLF